MDYQKHYDKLIERAKTRTLDGYKEKHHAIPRCLGGSNRKDNLVSLTPEEHYIAHLMLVKIHPGNEKLICAARMMCVTSITTKRTNKCYGWLKREYQKVAKQRIGSKNGMYNKHWYHDPVTHQNGVFLEGDKPVNWMPGKYAVPEHYCEKCKCIFQSKKRPRKQIDKFCVICRKEERIKRLNLYSPIGVEKAKRHYEVTHPDGFVEVVFGLNAWCIARNMHHAGARNVCDGKCTHYKGYKFRRLDTNQ